MSKLNIFLSLMVFVVRIQNSKADCPKPWSDCKDGRVKYYLHTGPQNESKYELKFIKKIILDAKFVRYEKIKLIILNNEDYSNAFLQNFIDEYFRKRNVNIISVDFSSLGNRKECFEETIIPSLKKIGKCTASLIAGILNVKHEIQLPQLHVIAFDIGVPIAGCMAKAFQQFKVLQRITALDPYRLPNYPALDLKLNSNSAKFVDVYHTNCGGFGVKFSDAHMEVYFNNGRDQPNCGDSLCSHLRALKYYIESINSETGFYAQKCLHHFDGSCELNTSAGTKIIGEYAYPENDCIPLTKEIYTLPTDMSYPYALGPSALPTVFHDDDDDDDYSDQE